VRAVGRIPATIIVWAGLLGRGWGGGWGGWGGASVGGSGGGAKTRHDPYQISTNDFIVNTQYIISTGCLP